MSQSSLVLAKYQLNDISAQLTVTIKKDLHMTQEDVANSNIVALLATYESPPPGAIHHLTISAYSFDSSPGRSVIVSDRV
jgi:hypothetical protein